MSKAKAEELGLEWLAEIGAHGQVAGPDSTLQLQPAAATAKACEKEGIAATDLDLVEFNEAFAAVGIYSARELGLDNAKVNVNGGAIALGHPVGMSGTRIVLHLALELKRRGGGVGAAALCGGGGQGDALIVRVPLCVWSRNRPARLGSRRGAAAVPDLVARARDGDAGAVARLISLVEDESPLLREVMAALAPHTGNAQIVGITGSPGVGKSTSTSALVAELRAPASGSACSPSTRRRRSPAAPCSATGCGCRTTRSTATSTSARWPPAATSAAWPGRPRRRCGCSTPPAAT